jgi:nucleoid-associated protein YgaU
MTSIEGLRPRLVLCLELRRPGSYVRLMKRIFVFVAAALMAAPAVLRGQDAAVEERLNKMSAQIQDLIDARDAQNKRIEDLARQLRAFQDQQGKPAGDYATQDDLKQLAAKLQEIDDKRQQDNEHILKEIEKLGKSLSVPAATPRSSRSGAAGAPADAGAAPPPDKGHFEYTIHEGDTLSAIARAYTDQGIKVTTDQILKANPGLKERNLRVGQKIIIPNP